MLALHSDFSLILLVAHRYFQATTYVNLSYRKYHARTSYFSAICTKKQRSVWGAAFLCG